jgi:hypothetical protein
MSATRQDGRLARRAKIGLALAAAVWLSGAGFARADPAPAKDLVELGKVGKSCTFKGKKLWGKFQVVNAFPDLKVQVVNAFPDVKVQVVNAFPDKCGKWQMVKAFPDVKIQFVDAFPDIKIQYVNAFPGVP